MEQPHLRPVDPPSEPPSSGETSKRPQRARPTKSLPTDRMRFEVQVRVLDLTAKLSSPLRRPVTEKLLAPAIGDVSKYTVMLSHNFWVDMGWLTKKRRGEYCATEALVAYSLHKYANDDDLPGAVAFLREAAAGSWAWQAIAPVLTAGSASIGEVRTLLMHAAEAGPDYNHQINNLLLWLKFVDLIRFGEGGVITVGTPATTTPTTTDTEKKTETVEKAAVSSAPPAPVGPTGNTVQKPTTNHPGDSGAKPVLVVSTSFSVSFTADDLAKLSPDQIATLVAAVGEVMSAKAAIS